MKVAVVTRQEVVSFAESVWNAFVNLLAMAEESDLCDDQVPAFHAFWYESEVQNGGHLQYLLNRGIREARRAPASLDRVGATAFSEILADAVRIWEYRDHKAPATVEEYVEQSLEGDFAELDSRFNAARPGLTELLMLHLEKNRSTFVTIL